MKTLLPALAASAAALYVTPAAEAHRLYAPGWWKDKTPAEIADGQRQGIAHSRAVIRFFKARPDIQGPKRDRILKWHRVHLRVTSRELAKTLASIEASRRAAAETAAEAAAAEATSATSSSEASSGATSAGGYASAATAACESGGDPSAVSSDGRYRGKWQFDQQTWDAHAPPGWQGTDPAAAPESVQDSAAGNVPYDAWPNC